MQLDWRLKAKEIQRWDHQFPIEIRDPKSGKLIRRHKVDFGIKNHDGSFELVECKGFETHEYRFNQENDRYFVAPGTS
jgi:hypothetical protein